MKETFRVEIADSGAFRRRKENTCEFHVAPEPGLRIFEWQVRRRSQVDEEREREIERHGDGEKEYTHGGARDRSCTTAL